MIDDDILDGRDLDRIVPLDFSSGSSDLLSVNWAGWQEELISLERKSQLGCIWFVVVGVGYGYVPIADDTKFPIFIIAFVLGVVHSVLQARRYRNLKDHGRYRYELFPNKVVRYSDRDYHVLEFSELADARVKPFGIVLVRRKRWRNWLLKYNNKDILVIPRSVKSYSAIVDYVRERIVAEEPSS